MGRLLALKLQEPLQVLNEGIEGAVLMVGGAAKLDAGSPFGHDLLFERLHQAGFANPSFATEQHDLAGTFFGLLPAPLQYAQLFFAPNRGG